MKSAASKTGAVVADFENPAKLLEAAQKLRDAGYKKFDCHSPFPIHGMDTAMGLKRSPLGYIVFIACMLGFLGGITLEWWTSTIDYPLVISGKPFFSYQAYGPVAFAIMVLSGAFISLFGMLALNKLPMYYHKLFNSKKFERATNDGFFISIDESDQKFDRNTTVSWLKEIGAGNIELVEDE
jgi:hypothetical protein